MDYKFIVTLVLIAVLFYYIRNTTNKIYKHFDKHIDKKVRQSEKHILLKLIHPPALDIKPYEHNSRSRHHHTHNNTHDTHNIKKTQEIQEQDSYIDPVQDIENEGE